MTCDVGDQLGKRVGSTVSSLVGGDVDDELRIELVGSECVDNTGDSVSERNASAGVGPAVDGAQVIPSVRWVDVAGSEGTRVRPAAGVDVMVTAQPPHVPPVPSLSPARPLGRPTQE